MWSHRIAPGLRIVPRGRDRLQIGIAPGQSVVLDRTGPHAEAVTALLRGEAPSDRQALADLIAAGVVQALASDPRPRPGRVRVLGDLGTDTSPLLDAAGLTCNADAPVALVLGRGEIVRETVDPLLRRRMPHLVVRIVDGVAVLGPFVQPGETACLRCLDAHRAEEDPEHLAVLHRYADACARVRPDGVPDPVDPLVGSLALCWAIHEVATHLRGARPATWSTTISLGGPDGLTATCWLRHPECPCCWLPELPSGPESPSSAGTSGTLEG